MKKIKNYKDAVNWMCSKGMNSIATGIRPHPVSGSPCARVWIVREDLPCGGPFGSGSGKTLVQAVRSFQAAIQRGEFTEQSHGT